MRTTILLFLILSLVPGAARADRITLIYGDVLEGTILKETDTTLTIRGPFGEVTLPKNEIQETVRGEVVEKTTPPSAAPAPANPAPKAPVPSGPAPVPDLQSGPPAPLDLLQRNVTMQAGWEDLEIAYIQRAYLGGQVVETQFIGRVIPPNYFRSKLTTPVPASPQFPQGGEVEYDMYRAKSTLYQVVKSPGQPVQYTKLDMSQVPGLEPGDNPIEGFKKGFAGAGSNPTLMQAVARNTRIIGVENTDGHDCWVLETMNTPDLIQAQIATQPPELQAELQQQMSQLGYIRSWVGKEDAIQWRMENYSPRGDLLLSMKMISVKPNTGLTPQKVRMKVPKGTEFMDVTGMVAGQFNELVGGSPGLVPIPGPNALSGGVAQPYQGAQPPGWAGQPGAPGQAPPQQGLPYGGPGVQQGLPGAPLQAVPPGQWPAPQRQSYTPQAPAAPGPALPVPPRMEGPATAAPAPFPQPQAQAPNPYPSAFAPQQPQQAPVYAAPSQQPQNYYAQPQQQPQNYYAPQAQPQQVPQQMMYQTPGGPPGSFQQQYLTQPGMPMQAPQQQQRRGGSFLSRLFGGGGGGGGNASQNQFMGFNQAGNQTMQVPMVNGQPQFPQSAPGR